jgi:hypothetical protein
LKSTSRGESKRSKNGGSDDDDDAFEDDDESDDIDADDDTTQRKSSSRKLSSGSLSALSPTGRKRRSELDKLLEAGSSSFHFETAKEATTRINGVDLGPIHVDVEDKTKAEPKPEVVSDLGEEEEEEFEPPAKRKKKLPPAEKPVPARKVPDRLLQQADTAATTATSTSRAAASPPKKRGNPVWMKKKQKMAARKGRPPKVGRKRKVGPAASSANALDPQDEARLALLEQLLPPNLFDDLESKLEEVDGLEADVEAMEFSFERTPFRESWSVHLVLG